MTNSHEPFDPENVITFLGGNLVKKSDYDSLLALYREIKARTGEKIIITPSEACKNCGQLIRVASTLVDCWEHKNGLMFCTNECVTQAEPVQKTSMNRPWPEFKKDLRSEGKSS